MQKQEQINSFWSSATCGWKMGKCGVFIPYHSHSHETREPRDPWEFPIYTVLISRPHSLFLPRACLEQVTQVSKCNGSNETRVLLIDTDYIYIK